MNTVQYNIKYLGNYIKDNCDDDYKVSEATLVLSKIRKSKKKRASNRRPSNP